MRTPESGPGLPTSDFFGTLFFHFTPAREWEKWLRTNFAEVRRSSAFGMVDLFVAAGPK